MEAFCKLINKILSSIIGIILCIAWLAGFAISGSGWAIIPFYAWYCVIELAMNYYQIFGYT